MRISLGRTMTLRRGLTLVVTLMLVAACAGSDGAGSNDSSDAGTTTTTGGAEATTTEMSVVSTSTTSSAAQSGRDSDFCNDYSEANVVDENLSLLDPQIDELLAEAVAQLDDLRSRAPAEIEGDVEATYDGMVLMEETFARHDYDMTAIPEDELKALSDPELAAAAQRIADYCGVGG